MLHVNSIGDRVCRPVYREAFVAYLTQQREHLCPDCHVRLAKNPLRVLDCKQPGCQQIAAGAPTISGYLCGPCREHFAAVRSLLDALKIAHEVDERLVRGLDYYTRTTFEFLNPALGAQNAVAGGGRYDGLVEELGGPPTPAIGFAIGEERILTSLAAQAAAPAAPRYDGVYVATAGEVALCTALELVQVAAPAGLAGRCGSGGTKPQGPDAAGQQGGVPLRGDPGQRRDGAGSGDAEGYGIRGAARNPPGRQWWTNSRGCRNGRSSR